MSVVLSAICWVDYERRMTSMTGFSEFSIERTAIAFSVVPVHSKRSSIVPI